MQEKWFLISKAAEVGWNQNGDKFPDLKFIKHRRSNWLTMREAAASKTAFCVEKLWGAQKLKVWAIS